MNFHITKHLRIRMAERGLNLENLKSVIRSPGSVQQLQKGQHGGRLKRFRKTVDSKTLVAVAEIKG